MVSSGIRAISEIVGISRALTVLCMKICFADFGLIVQCNVVIFRYNLKYQILWTHKNFFHEDVIICFQTILPQSYIKLNKNPLLSYII